MKVQGFCTFPHGHLSIYLFITSISAYLFAISSSWGCYFIDVDATLSSREGSSGELFDDHSAGFGLFSYEDGFKSDGEKFNWICYAYNQEQLDSLDSTFQTARAIAVVANVMIGVSMLFLILTCCVQYSPVFLKLIGALMISGGIAQGATFIIFQSDLCSGDPFSCKFYLGAGICIAAVITCWVTGIIAVLLPASVAPFNLENGGPTREPFEPGTVTETETIMADGTTKITRTTVNQDGSKTIEETVYDPPSADNDNEQFDEDDYYQGGARPV
mmetsp:Transcript_4437/g.5812  ORF Transcript_4437/g.5812 Transcript_4437/m.5812 type:complete len:273 (-) Transcript_4437:422-1240(-)|eukprot:CAMPEP_0198136818 /NCGR_PEP_ID=MMETSP1443-20131203/402_1 /TAXON_ID=186043 /ORGANISM="Entomoneis sp., Strain CCMP2396" /LENGTH=272 /DNA_ID=CAMNT_0043798097 /DNA_START=167 /DNA_END=985 /DNA_ORIENTATION=+